MTRRTLLLTTMLTLAGAAALVYAGGGCPFSGKATVAETAAEGETAYSADDAKPTCDRHAKGKDKCGECKKADGKCTHCRMKGASGQVADALAAMEKAQTALEDGKTDAAAKHLAAARALLKKSHAALNPTGGKHADLGPDGSWANTHCPIMGNKVDLSKVPAKLTTEFHGQKVAFCCGGCVPAWEKLSEDEKLAKLKKINAKTN